MSEIADLYSKVVTAQKALKGTKDVPEMSKNDLKKLLDAMEKNLKDLPKQREELLACIKQVNNMDKNIESYNKDQNVLNRYSGSMVKFIGTIKEKSKFLTDLKDVASRLDGLTMLSRDSKS